ncbi:hypothetical protein [Leuconostoc lactis]|uniref:hypothetical protein n=1 Tax=Leuconostoc lactis TaxID=1246 RepID=UPI0024AD9331|nr:hypothetical protein [Leuconostoc lactis]MDI6495492.1 hypothetical protein [Leuconostoc lactis]
MTKEQLKELRENLEQKAREQIELLNNRSYKQLSKTKHVTYDEREAKDYIERVKALDYVLSDDEALSKVLENDGDYSAYVSSYYYN